MTPAEHYAAEIRGYLLGRLSTRRVVGSIGRARRQGLKAAPIRRWWIFEGHRYACLSGSLGDSWEHLARRCLRLMQTFNPRWKLLERPEGLVDWPRTFSGGFQPDRPAYACQGSGVGLTEAERSALQGWAAWIAEEWLIWCGAYASGREADASPIRSLGRVTTSEPPLHRWAHTARRSRWPLLREVVTETLRCSLEPDHLLDRLPLPEEHAVLFELLCLVRCLRCLAHDPVDIAWLSHSMNNNTVRVGEVEAHFQMSIPRVEMLTCPPYAGDLASATAVFPFGVHQAIDLFIPLHPPRGGYDGILIECKSGGQQAAATIEQLTAYRAALRCRGVARCLIWGLLETPKQGAITPEQLVWLRARPAVGDTWVFSGADDIGRVLEAAGVISAPPATATIPASPPPPPPR